MVGQSETYEGMFRTGFRHANSTAAHPKPYQFPVVREPGSEGSDLALLLSCSMT